MPRRKMLTDRQRAALLDLPTEETAMLRHYTLADDDLEIIRARRRPHNRFGFAHCDTLVGCWRQARLFLRHYPAFWLRNSD